ncbi:uncharacterized protein BCR38DRAFT_337102 [Pseudomassariella vexata]|uniref:P-loop containing nucleoside triphosphate hydrolase protein n=1 Tax=Pseudomassariella vexata TaxID=1141098 RepID=A0A1Y2E7F0_9PEZI|nr:uncharacterized protein BCR38DRAFT_337102 [Pseudomassariella vexata]ORY67472.1 hypothetical protein BCR38DRAFT_337102 [Pseudomassariella vexata]
MPALEPSSRTPSSKGSDSNESDISVTERSINDAHPSSDADDLLSYHLNFLQRAPAKDDLDEVVSTPLFTQPVLKHAEALGYRYNKTTFRQYALLAGNIDSLGKKSPEDPRIFYNVTAPSSVFICGSQGSGKSHSLSCLLESCLIPSKLGKLPRPLTGIVFHYDTFISDNGGTPCEAAYLSSHPNVNVRVLCAPTNTRTITNTYRALPNVKVEQLKLDEGDLNTERMLDLMAVGEGNMPLYMHVVQRILRDMRMAQQEAGSTFKYTTFQQMIMQSDLTPLQRAPLQQRLDTLESYMFHEQVTRKLSLHGTMKSKQTREQATDWIPKARELIIVDLSCPCVTAEMACSLFNICLSLFLEQDSSLGRVVALDEAHKYMGESAECQTLTNSLLATIRLQRHLGARVIISTQEPTISPKLLDLCSITFVHRFTSPDWLQVLKRHLAGISTSSKIAKKLDGSDEQLEDSVFDGLRGVTVTSENPTLELFSRIVALKVGEALVFAPSAIVSLENQKDAYGKSRTALKRLAHDVLRVRVRARLTMDGGRSIMAT